MTVGRQQNLFAAEDWTVAYKAFTNIDFQAYDFDTIRLAMVEYIRTNFPENYNDYIESSEFVAIIELLAYLSQSIAFRMDVNTRENFLETAERKDSVFKLARMLGYNPKRNLPASGIMKVTSVRTSESLVDSLGNQLNNRTVYWDDANNTQSYEQFITIMNSAMSKTNRFTSPIKSGTVNGVPTELYQLNTPITAPITYNFTLRTNGIERNYDVVNPDFDDNRSFFERHPDPTNLMNLIYRNDGKGLASVDTGFFIFFRQGRLSFTDFNYTTPVQNRIENVNVANINENDVYFQEINANGLVLNQWSKVPNTVGQTLNYNSLALNTRNLYAIENLGQNGVRLRFPDGNFGNIPQGVYRMWYRVSDPSRFTIQPQDARTVTVTIPYQNAIGENHAITLTVSLQYSVSNSLPPESLTAIKDRAPQVFYTQNRMVNAQDYNVFPQSQSSNITKLKATNRTHAGHSRYIDLNDPTGTFNNVDTFAEDAYVYVEDSPKSRQVVINNNTTPLELAISVLPGLLKGQEINNFVYYGVQEIWNDPTQNGQLGMFDFTENDNVLWNPLPQSSTGSTGYFTEQFTTGDTNVLVNNITNRTRQLTENNFIKMINPNNPTNFKWVRIVNVINNGQLSAGVNTSAGPFTLSENVDANWRLGGVIVGLRKLFTTTEASSIETEIKKQQTFALGYDLKNDVWYVIPGTELTTANKTGKYALNTSQRGSDSWLVLLEYTAIDQSSYKYNITVRGQDYVVQSKNDLRFYNVKNVKVVDRSNRSSQDLITLSTANSQPGEEEIFQWTGTAWQNLGLLTEHTPVGLSIDLPLKTRDTIWSDIDVSWISNFGIFLPAGVGNNLEDYVTNNQYVTETRVELNTFYQVGAATTDSNVIVANNVGQISFIPSTITIPFNANTFGNVIVDTNTATPFIAYRQLPSGESVGNEVVFKAPLGGTPTSFGVDGSTEDANTIGRVYFTAYNEITQEGTLEYRGLQNNTYHRSKDKTDTVFADKLIVNYLANKDKLNLPIVWEVYDVFKEADGFSDPRKIKVAPVDTDDDMVPDRPQQFTEYVGKNDIVLFEYFTDFDGYIYDRPVEGVIRDYRLEDNLQVNNSANKVSPGSYDNFVTLSETDWMLVKTKSVAEQFITASNAAGIVFYVFDEDKTYQLTPLSTNINELLLVESQDYFVKKGRGQTQNTAALDKQNSYIRWQHVAPNDIRIDPSISNVVEMIILTTAYNNKVSAWKANQENEFPLEPSSDKLNLEFAELNTFKSASDMLTFRSAKFKLLFGNRAEDEVKAKFRVVKLSDQISDNELKTRIISTIDEYFSVDNWEFGETFYFTELSTYIHQRLGSSIGSIVILPKNTTGRFGEMFQVKAEPNELFISTATVNDIEIISRLDNQTLRTDI